MVQFNARTMNKQVDLGPDYEDVNRIEVAQNTKSSCVDSETFVFHKTTGFLYQLLSRLSFFNRKSCSKDFL
jgi:hypothetical protein